MIMAHLWTALIWRLFKRRQKSKPATRRTISTTSLGGPTSRLKNVATTQRTRLTRPAPKRKSRGSKIKSIWLLYPVRDGHVSASADLRLVQLSLGETDVWMGEVPVSDDCFVCADTFWEVGGDRLVPVAGFLDLCDLVADSVLMGRGGPHTDSDCRWSALNSRVSWGEKKVNQCSSAAVEVGFVVPPARGCVRGVRDPIVSWIAPPTEYLRAYLVGSFIYNLNIPIYIIKITVFWDFLFHPPN